MSVSSASNSEHLFFTPFTLYSDSGSGNAVFAIPQDGTGIVMGEFAVTTGISLYATGMTFHVDDDRTWLYSAALLPSPGEVFSIDAASGAALFGYDVTIQGALDLGGDLTAGAIECSTLICIGAAAFNDSVDLGGGAFGTNLSFDLGTFDTVNATSGGYQYNGTRVVGAQEPAISNAAGGATIDVQARAALNSLLAACRSHGLIAP